MVRVVETVQLADGLTARPGVRHQFTLLRVLDRDGRGIRAGVPRDSTRGRDATTVAGM